MTDLYQCRCGTKYATELWSCPRCLTQNPAPSAGLWQKTPPPQHGAVLLATDSDTCPYRMPPWPPTSPEHLIQDRLVRKWATERANEIWLARESQNTPQPQLTPLASLLEEPDDQVAWRVAGLWPADGNIVLSAQYKAGKTTLIGNIVRCLADGGSLLGSDMGWVIADQHVTTQLGQDERVAVLDLELPRRTLRTWLREQKIADTDRVYVESLRGRTGEIRILDENRLNNWAQYLASLRVKVLIVDPLAPLLSACEVDENDNSGVAKVLAALDTLKSRAGISELLVAHHMGHSGERSRGASRLRDWPDAEWRLNREDDEDPASDRYFTAFGRDVDVRETRLEYIAETRKLIINGGSRKDTTGDRIKAQILQAVSDRPGINKRDLEARIKGNATTKRNALADLIGNDKVRVEQSGAAQLHYLGGDDEV